MNRRTSILCSLLLTAALLVVLPSLLDGLSQWDGQRMAPRLRPSKTQPLVIWLLTDPTEGGTHLSRQISLFEKQNPGVRVFLRKADATELLAKETVLPDVLLFGPGAFGEPGKALLPLALDMGLSPAALMAGQSAMVQYALPLWVAPSVLAVPASLLPLEIAPASPTPSSFFQLGTPAPQEEGTPLGQEPPLPQASEIPWASFLLPDVLLQPKGMALQQLLSMCPADFRAALVEGLLRQGTDTPRPTSPPAQGKSVLPKGKAQTAAPPAARVLSLNACQRATAAGEALVPFPMTPAASENVLFLGLCRESEPALAFVKHLFSQEARGALSSFGLLPTVPANPSADPLYGSLSALYANNPLLANAFEHTAQELQALCLDGFARQVDPVETLLRLR